MNQDLYELDAKIKNAKKHDQKTIEDQIKAGSDSNSHAGIQAGFELVASIAVSTAIGYGLDHWLGTKPLFIILLFFMGVFAGFFNVYRVSKNIGSAVGYSELHRKEKQDKTAPKVETTEDRE